MPVTYDTNNIGYGNWHLEYRNYSIEADQLTPCDLNS